jgi:hypothetical protein
VLVIAIDGWTDAGLGGTTAAEALRDAFEPQRLGVFDSDALYDYRDRRPQLAIDRGILGEPEWPELTVERLTPPAGPPLILVTGPEPDLGWQALGRDLVRARRARRRPALRRARQRARADPAHAPGAADLHLVRPGPRRAHRPPARAGDRARVLPGRDGGAAARRRADDGRAVGPGAPLRRRRVPGGVAGPARAAVTAYLGTPVDLSAFEAPIAENRAKLDVAATSSDEVTEHVAQLERLYDAELEAERLSGALDGAGTGAMSEERVPSADELAAEIERFLKGRAD